MAKLFEGKVTLKNGVAYDVDYEVSASYTGTTHTLLNGGTGLDGTVTFTVKSPTYAWTKDVTVGITFGDDDSRQQSVSISLEKDDYTKHSASFSVTPSTTYYGSLKFWIKNNASGDKPLTLIKYRGTGLGSLGNGITNLHAGGLCGIYASTSSPSFELTGNFFAQEEFPGGDLDEEGVNLNYYWGSPTLKATIEHFSGYEKSTPSYAIKYRSYKADGTLRSQYLSGKTYSWTIDKNNNYRETIVDSLPLFLREGSEELNYPIREYFLYYNGSWKSEPFYVTPFTFTLPDSITAKKQSSNNYVAEVNLGNLNKWIDLNYSRLSFLTFKCQDEAGEITKINNVLVGKISGLTEGTSNLLTYGIYKNDTPDDTLIISKEINTILGLKFSAEVLSCTKVLSRTKSYVSGGFSALQRGEEMSLSVRITESTNSLWNEEVEATLIVKNEDGQEKEIYLMTENYVQGELKDITFGNFTIDELIEINSEKANKFYLKVASSGTEETIYLEKDIYAYDYTKSMIINNKIEYELVSNQDRVKGSCNIKNGSVLEIAFPEGQFKDDLKIKITFYNKNNSSVSCEFSNSSPQTINTIPLKNLLNNSSKPIEIKLAQKNPIEVPYTVKYIYNNKEHIISEGKEKLIITIPPLLTPTLAYRSRQVGINCEPSEESALDIRAEGNFTKVSFQNKDGKETGYIDLQEGGLKDSEGKDFYLTQSTADDIYLTQNAADGIYLKQEEYKQKIIDNTSNINTINTNINTINTNINAINTNIGTIDTNIENLINTITSTRYVVVTCVSDEINTYKNAWTAGQVEFEKKLDFGTIPVSDYNFIIGIKFVSGNKDKLFDSSNPLHIYSTEVSENGNIVVTCKGRYRERTEEDNGAKFKVSGMLYYSMVST